MTLNQMLQFVTVAKYMSISKAAEELIISHSAISRGIAMLEDELGVTLLNRTNKVLSLTPAGELFARDSRVILQAVSEMKQAVMQEGYEIEEELSIRTINTDHPELNALFGHFISEYPSVPLLLDQADPRECCDSLRSGEANAIITVSFAYDQYVGSSKDFVRADLYYEDFKAVVGENSPLSQLPYLDLFAVENLPRPLTIADDDLLFPRQFVSMSRFSESHIPAHMMESDLSSLLLRIRAGSGWAMLPEFIADSAIGCKSLDIKGLDTSYTVCLCWRHDDHTAALSSFLKLAREHFPSIPDSDDVTSPAVLLF